MPRIASQTPLTTVRKPVEFTGAGATIVVVNHSGTDTTVHLYAVPLLNASSTLTDHLLFHQTVPQNSTVIFNQDFRVELPRTHRFEAVAGVAGRLTLTMLGG